MTGWVKLYRSLVEWEWWDDINTMRLFVYCLIMANHEDVKWHGVDIPRGSFNTSIEQLARAIGKKTTIQEARTAINHLISTGEITSKSTNRGSVVTVCNYDKYQMQEETEQQANQQANNKPINRQTTSSGEKEKEKEKKNPPITPYKENKNKKEKSEQEEKKEENIIASTIVEAPKKKFTVEEKKFHGELKTIFCEEWMKTHGEEFYWSAAAMTATIKIADQIKFKMTSQGFAEISADQIKENFRLFVHKILTSPDSWLRTNATPQIIASKFNEIYTQLKNGNASTHTNGTNNRPSMVERTLRKYAAMYGDGQPDGALGTQR